eukprot:1342829-Pyramimonas_sp.AAC.1
MGAHKEFGDLLLDPQLFDYVAKEVERDAQVMNQVRKAREERVLARKADARGPPAAVCPLGRRGGGGGQRLEWAGALTVVGDSP